MAAKTYISSQMNQTMVNVSRKKMVYWERKNSHRCVQCNKPSEDGKASCPECRAKNNEAARQARLFFKSLGLCSECGKNRVFKDEKTCPECRAKSVTAYSRTEEQRERYRALNRELYWRYSEQGICVRCGRRKAAEGRKMCCICAMAAGQKRTCPIMLPKRMH